MSIMEFNGTYGKVYIEAKYIVAIHEFPGFYDDSTEIQIHTLGNMPPVSITQVKLEDILTKWHQLAKDNP